MKSRMVRQWREIVLVLRHDWDRLSVGITFLIFGIYSMAHPVQSVRSSIPFEGMQLIFNSEFIIAGLALVAGLFVDRPWLYRLGCVVAGLGVLTVAGIILAVSGTRATALCILLLGLSLKWVVAFRRPRPHYLEPPVVTEAQMTAVVQRVLRAEEVRTFNETEGHEEEERREDVKEGDDDA